MTLLSPTSLLFLVAVPVFTGLYIWAPRRRRKYALRYASLSLVKEALGRGPGIRRHIPPALYLLSLAFMLVALARPITVVKVPSQERSEEHTSELQSRRDLVCRLLLEKKKYV